MLASMRTRTAAAAVAALALVAACAGDDGANGDEAREHAEAILLTLADFPDGWTGAPPAEGAEQAEAEFRACVGVEYFDVATNASSDDFTSGGTPRAASEVHVFDGEENAVAAFEALAEAQATDADDCLKSLITAGEDGVADGFEIGAVEVDELAVTAPSGLDDVQAWQVAAPFQITSGDAAGVEATAYLDLVYLRVGETIAAVQAADVPSPFDSELRDELVATVAGRMTE